MSNFLVLADSFGNPYFTIRIKDYENLPNLTEIRNEQFNIAGFLDPIFTVTTRKTGPFTKDFTTRDDVLLAFLSLFLLLVIDAIVATVLLRTRSGEISNFGFSVKVVLEYFRDFKLVRAFGSYYRRHTPRQSEGKVNIRLLAIAISLLVLIIGLEIGVLFMTDPQLRSVSNYEVTFRVKQPVLPHWDDIRFHTRASFNRPCTAMALKGVEQGPTRINGCVSSNLSISNFELFAEISESADFEVVSRLHEFGADHQISINGLSVTYAARAYFSLYDGLSRMMRHEKKEGREELYTEAVHLQYFAYLFSAYNLNVQGDTEFLLNELNGLDFNFSKKELFNVTILEIKGNKIVRNMTEYRTKVRGRLPKGVAALRLGQHYFRGTSSIVVGAADQMDLFLEEGVGMENSAVWEEVSRPINLLSLIVTLGAALVLLIVLRVRLKPVAVADIAGIWVKSQVGADLGRSPVELNATEIGYFKVQRGGEEEYVHDYESASGGGRSE